MADPEDVSRHRKARRRQRSHSVVRDEKLDELGGQQTVTHEPDVEGLRRIRIERLDASTSNTGPASSSKMATESHASVKEHTTHRRRHHRSSEGKKHRTKRSASVRDGSGAAYVYGAPAERLRSSRIIVSETRKLDRDGDSSQSEGDRGTKPEAVKEQPNVRKIKVIYVQKDGSRSKPNERQVKAEPSPSHRPKESGESAHRSRARHSRRKSAPDASGPSPHKRSASPTQLPTETRPSLRRSNTTGSRLPSTKPTPATANTSAKRTSIFGGLFGSPAPQHVEPERLIECLTCLSDDIPRSKSAKLKCGHRMCHPCLRRIFKLSITDPQHMPPKCCTADHIPLKHVERLFDDNFKRTWNRKFQEYSTKNRIYCPGRRCGEWIKPQNIQKEDGKKVGRCSRCKTKVCCMCNGKWHGTKDCPKDEETNRLLEAAKQAGWQRCYSCRTMVELKEGCNHMTCRCTAQFCMICGLKWKTCNCPWFNYEAVEADRLDHMRPVEAELEPQPAEPGPHPRRLRRRHPPNTYGEEMDNRRQQERHDEEIARRLQRVAVDDDVDDDYQGGIGDINGVGNAAGHFMNQDYIRAAHNILTGNYDQANAAANYVMGVTNARGGARPAPQELMRDRYPVPLPRAASPPPLLRRHTMRENAYNSAQSTRPSERVIPRRTRNDYEAEAAVHMPLGRGNDSGEARSAVLAGLSGAGRGSNRVNAWRNHIETGVIPPEGVLSMNG